MTTEWLQLGRRIAVIGTSGCGKTYVAETLAARLGYICICNDAIIWRPNWQETPHEQRVAQIDAATKAEAWTFNGNLAARNPDDLIVPRALRHLRLVRPAATADVVTSRVQDPNADDHLLCAVRRPGMRGSNPHTPVQPIRGRSLAGIGGPGRHVSVPPGVAADALHT